MSPALNSEGCELDALMDGLVEAVGVGGRFPERLRAAIAVRGPVGSEDFGSVAEQVTRIRDWCEDNGVQAVRTFEIPVEEVYENPSTVDELIGFSLRETVDMIVAVRREIVDCGGAFDALCDVCDFFGIEQWFLDEDEGCDCPPMCDEDGHPVQVFIVVGRGHERFSLRGDDRHPLRPRVDRRQGADHGVADTRDA